jgi:hypothetical protein
MFVKASDALAKLDNPFFGNIQPDEVKAEALRYAAERNEPKNWGRVNAAP